ncbi:MAG: histidine triad (HIT) family protein [Pseudomonadales bacterium]|jgi:histidine triad (HIT) family protein
MASHDNCIFCQIVAGKAQSQIVFENDKVMAFMDVMPASGGHTLLVTKNHYDSVLDASPDDIAEIGRVSVAIANAVKHASGANGIGVYQLNGGAAGQTVFHYHMHFIPQSEGAHVAIHSREMGDMDSIAAMADKVRLALA